jgi:hypothetical protein
MKPTFRHHRTAILSGLSLMMRSDLVYNELVAPMTYDHWKATNPQDEWLGSEPWERDDMSEFCEPGSAWRENEAARLHGAPTRKMLTLAMVRGLPRSGAASMGRAFT